MISLIRSLLQSLIIYTNANKSPISSVGILTTTTVIFTMCTSNLGNVRFLCNLSLDQTNIFERSLSFLLHFVTDPKTLLGQSSNPSKVLISLVKNLFSGVSGLHQSNIIHTNLNPENVYITLLGILASVRRPLPPPPPSSQVNLFILLHKS